MRSQTKSLAALYPWKSTRKTLERGVQSTTTSLSADEDVQETLNNGGLDITMTRDRLQ